jgi:hypothetical protein
MSDETRKGQLTILSAEEARSRFGDLTSGEFLQAMRAELWDELRAYHKPEQVSDRRALASALAEVVGIHRTGVLCVTDWGADTNPIDEYRKSRGEHRSLHEAPVHLFSKTDGEELKCVLDFALELDWDCFLFDGAFRYLIKLSHDGYVDFTGSDQNTLKDILARLAKLRLRSLSIGTTENDR